MKLTIKKQILSENDLIAQNNKKLFDKNHVLTVNVMASPGAGKTSVILSLCKLLKKKYKVGVIEGDIASRIDTDAIVKAGFPAVQINTGGNCHLDAVMVKKAVQELPLTSLDIVFVENVGNLICPAETLLGTHKNMVIASVPEGSDKPYKYPSMFASADIVLLNKYDLLRSFDFDRKYFVHGVHIVNTTVSVFDTSVKKHTGLDNVISWIEENFKSL
jgi:hydrogenase nickel incorporation protein HypB